MKCITLHQPWATICCLQHPLHKGMSAKGYETRSWPTNHRGPLLIHAAKKKIVSPIDIMGWDFVIDFLRLSGFQTKNDFAYGAILGKVDVVDCISTNELACLDADVVDDYAWFTGDYSNNRFAWKLENPALFKTPIPYRGQQGFFNVNEDELKLPDQIYVY